MNREEAIAILNHKVSACLHGTEWGEALDMAISALEQEPCNTDTCKVVKAYMNEWDKPNNSDAISRQAVLNCLTATKLKKFDFIPHAREEIKKLPSVNPVLCEDAISRQAVLDYIDKMKSELTADGRRMIRRRTLEEYISDTLPPVTPQPKMGRWVHNKCDKCGASRPPLFDNYCPNCGAKMIEPQEVEE